MNTDWREDALCRETDPDDEVWFPPRGGSRAPAKRICGLCAVRVACLADALAVSGEQDKHGIRAGTTPGERRRLRRDTRPLAPVIPLGVPAVPDKERRAA